MRKIVFVGNCQALAMMNLYKRFGVSDAKDIVSCVPSYQEMTPDRRKAILDADLIVEQVLDLRQVDLSDIAPSAERIGFPMVSGGFIWPFAGSPHPANQSYWFLDTGPYGAELGDSYLSRKLLTGVAVDDAVREYMSLDINSTRNLDRLFEIFIDRQSQRDASTGFSVAGVISKHFRDESLFSTPYHPNIRISLELAAQLFRRLGVPSDRIERMCRILRVPPFPREMMPIHPSVIRHFNLRFATEDTRYLSHDGCWYTFEEFAGRYMRYEWNGELREGRALVHTDAQRAIVLLRVGLARSPDSADGHFGLGVALKAEGKMEAAESHLRRAIQLNPASGGYYHALAHVLVGAGRIDEAYKQIRLALACDESDTHLWILSAQIAMQVGDLEAAEEAARKAIELDPGSGLTLSVLGRVRARKGAIAEAVDLIKSAAQLAPNNAGIHVHLSHLLVQADDIPGAIAAVRRAIQIDGSSADNHLHLSRLHLRAGEVSAAESSARRAVALNSSEERFRAQLANVLQQMKGGAHGSTSNATGALAG